MTSNPVKVLAVGSALGSFKELFSKIAAIDAKHGKFDFVLCTGDFFGPIRDGGEDKELEQLLNDEIEATIDCYIMQGDSPVPDAAIQKFAKTGGQLAKNVFMLTKSGLVTTAQGLRIASLGGVFDHNIFYTSESAPGFASPFFSSQTISRLLSNTMSNSTSNPSSQSKLQSLASIISSSSSTQLVDILLTNSWPEAVAHFTNPPSSAAPPPLAPPLDDVVKRLRPRYHFSGGGYPPIFWEREPFVWEDDELGRSTRFLSLGAFGGPAPATGKKPRWFYAFSIVPHPSQQPPAPRPANATKNPFTEAVASRPQKRHFDDDPGLNYIFGDVKQPNKRMRADRPTGPPGQPPPGYKCKRCEGTDHFINDCPERTKPPEGYVCRICNEPGHLVRDCPTKHAVGDTGGRKPREGYVCRACGSELHYIDDCPVANANRNTRGGGGGGGGKRRPPRELGPDECWFCLSNPNLAKHLILSIGTEVYLSLPKGQLVRTQSARPDDDPPGIPGGGHVLIIPIPHYPTYSTIPADQQSSIRAETKLYQNALRTMYAKYGYTAVCFDIGRVGAGGHAHVQVIPVPLSLEHKIESKFILEGRQMGIEFEENAEAAFDLCADGRTSYFAVDLPSGKKMMHIIKEGMRFDLQFGRHVLATLLRTPERLDWKACALPDDEDRADAQEFKAVFPAFDPALV